MGCCCSKRSPSAPLGLQSLNLPVLNTGYGLQIGVSTAGWLSALPLDEQVAIVREKRYTLAALFEGRDRRTSGVYPQVVAQVFHNSLRTHGPGLKESLAETFRILAEKQSGSPKNVGAGTLMCLDHRTRCLYAASRGSSACSVSQLQHGLAVQYTSGIFVLTPQTGSNEVGEELSGAISVSEMQLTPYHEMVLLASPQLWKIMDKDEIALRGHFHIRANFGGDRQVADAKGTNEAVESAAARLPNTAQHLVTHAHDKNGQRHGPHYMRPYGTDIVAVALTLRWPSSSINQAFARGELVERCQDLSLAAVRWRRIKALLIECRRARRQMLTRKWQQLVAQELQAGKERARLLETQAWLDQGLVLKVSPSLKAVNEQGHAVSLPVPVPINLNAIAG